MSAKPEILAFLGEAMVGSTMSIRVRGFAEIGNFFQFTTLQQRVTWEFGYYSGNFFSAGLKDIV